MNEKNKLIVCRLCALAVALLIWELMTIIINENILMVSPVDVVKRLTTIWREDGFFSSLWFTFYHITVGFLTGLTCGILLAAIAARFKVAEVLLWPWMATIKAVPVASFVVICLIWLSARNLSVFISFLIVLPVVYQNILSGIKAKDGKMDEVARVFEVSWIKRFRYITLPQIAPFLMSACKVTAAMAWKAGVAAEIIGTPNGSIGRELYLSKIFLDTDDLFAWTVVIVFLSVVSEKIFLNIVKHFLRIVGKVKIYDKA